LDCLGTYVLDMTKSPDVAAHSQHTAAVRQNFFDDRSSDAACRTSDQDPAILEHAQLLVDGA
jgi:hypothetical protein